MHIRCIGTGEKVHRWSNGFIESIFIIIPREQAIAVKEKISLYHAIF
ncbi:hypothetical protein [Methanococcoides methylutens]|nr:hypothetical protein [Methanococcoides methylutens]